MSVITTARLRLERFEESDAPFILKLVNEPSWLQFIGDKNVHDLDGARAYLRNGPLAMYAQHGHGLYRIDHGASGEPIGMCGLIKRDTLEHVDIGYAFLPQHWGQGYAEEAAQATVAFARDVLGLKRLLAITAPDNARSVRLLGKLGMTYGGEIETRPGDVTALYLVDFPSNAG